MISKSGRLFGVSMDVISRLFCQMFLLKIRYSSAHKVFTMDPKQHRTIVAVDVDMSRTWVPSTLDYWMVHFFTAPLIVEDCVDMQTANLS